MFFCKNLQHILNNQIKINTNININNKLKNILIYKAENINNDLKRKILFLNKNIEIKYKNLLIYADYIKINWETGHIYGRGKINSKGEIITPIYLIDKKNKYYFSEFNFNYINNLGDVKNIINIQNGKKFFFAKKIKKKNNTTFDVNNGFYTTDKYYINKKDSFPDYHFKINQIKYNNTKSILLGSTQIYIKKNPIPIIIPFFYFNENKFDRLSNLLQPKFGKNLNKIFFIKNLGYYYSINKYINFKIYTNLFSNQNYQINNTINYQKDYKYYGYFIIDYSSIFQKNKKINNYDNTIITNMQWQHKELPTINKNWFFSSEINFLESNLNKININEQKIDVKNNFTKKNIQSLMYLEKYSIDNSIHSIIKICYNQYNNYKFKLLNSPIYNLKIPQFSLEIKKQFPLSLHNSFKKNIIENLNLNYIFNIENNIQNIKQEELFTSKILKKINNKINNQINIRTKYLFKNCINMFFGINYEDTRFFNFKKKIFNNNNKYRKKNIIYNLFNSYKEIKAYSNIQTYLKGSINFKDNNKNTIKILRHLIIPSISYTLIPNNNFFLKKYYQYNNINKYFFLKKKYYNNENKNFYHIINIEINNKFQILIKNNKNDSLDVKKIKLLDNLLIKSSYNLSKKIFKWNNIIINGKTSIFDDKLKINFNININPYTICNKFICNEINKNIFYTKPNYLLQQLSFLIKYSLNNYTNKNNYLKCKKTKISNKLFNFDDENYKYFKNKWNFNLGVIYNYSKENFIKQKNVLIYFNTNINFTPYLTIEYSTNFDLINQKFVSNKISIIRKLRNFQLNFTWTPFNQNENWYIFLGINKEFNKKNNI